MGSVAHFPILLKVGQNNNRVDVHVPEDDGPEVVDRVGHWGLCSNISLLLLVALHQRRGCDRCYLINTLNKVELRACIFSQVAATV